MKSADISPEGTIAFGAPEENPFCQISGREISLAQCIATQGGLECFGCAASTRLCEQCNLRHAEISAVGMCEQCAATELAREKLTKPYFPVVGEMVQCQIVKRNIGVAMCMATQGAEGCQGCPVPSRLCEKCRERPSRFPAYGFCFKCSIEEYAPDWDPSQVVVVEGALNPQTTAKFDELGLHLSAVVPRTDRDAGKGKADKKFSILVVGADTSQFETQILRDRRVRHWGADDIKADGSIPSVTEKLIYCARAIKKAKTAILKRLIAEARNAGQSLKVWDVPHQGRLRQVLGEELTPLPPVEPKIVQIEIPAEASPTAVSSAKPQPEVQNEPTKGGESVSQTPEEIVAAHMESTGGDTNALLKIVCEQHPTASRTTIYNAKARIKKKGGLVQKSQRKVQSPSVSPANTLTQRLFAAIRKIEEGLNELNEVAGEIGGMDARLQLLAPFEVALRQVYGSQPPKPTGQRIEAQVLEIICALRAKSNGDRVSVNAVTESFESLHEKEYHRKVTAKWIGHVIRNLLGIQTEKSNGVFVLAEIPHLDQLCQRYGVAFPSGGQSKDGDNEEFLE